MTKTSYYEYVKTVEHVEDRRRVLAIRPADDPERVAFDYLRYILIPAAADRVRHGGSFAARLADSIRCDSSLWIQRSYLTDKDVTPIVDFTMCLRTFEAWLSGLG